MKKLALALLLITPFAAAKADIIKTYTFSFTGGSYYTAMNFDTFLMYDVMTDNLLSGSGTYVYNDTTKNAISLSLTLAGVTSSAVNAGALGNGTYGVNSGRYMTDTSFSVFSGDTYASFVLGTFKSAMGGDMEGWQSTSFTSNLQTTGAPITPVPEPSSYVLGFAGLVGMVGFASSRKKKAAALNAPALLA